MSDLNNEFFRIHLRQQLGFLQSSCRSYDMGFHDEAIRIATVIRVLIYDSARSISLLRNLNATNINLFTTYWEPPEKEYGYEIGYMFSMGVIGGGRRAGYRPNLEDFSSSSKTFPVDKWWNQIVFILNPKVKLSRKDIVLAAVNKDGGAHVDDNLTPEYEALMKEVWGTIIIRKGDETYKQPVENMHLVAIRTMGNELLKSPELLEFART